MGFICADADHLVFMGDYFTVLKSGVNLTEEALDPIKEKFMAPEELKHHLMVKANQKAFAEKQAQDKSKMAALEKQAMIDRRECVLDKEHIEVKDAKANTLKYGANVKKFEAPVEQKQTQRRG